MPASKLLFRVDASRKIGTGHLLECLWFARDSKFDSVFCVNNDAVAIKLAKRFGFPVETAESIDRLNSLIKRHRPDVLVFDLVNINAAYLKKVVSGFAKIVVMNALFHPVMADAQVATVFVPHPQNNQHAGGKYVLLKPAVQGLPAREPRRRVKNILLLFGGGDPGGFTLRSLRCLAKLPGDFHVTVVVGGANRNFPGIARYLKIFPKTSRLYRNITDERALAALMRGSDIALASGGYTLSELMHFGVPTVILAQNEIESRRIYPIFSKNAFVNLGLGRQVGEQDLRKALIRLTGSYPLRAAMSRKARRVVDGRGIARFGKILLKLTRKN